MEQEKIGKFIAELRKKHTFTQLQLAEKLGVSDKTISRWETGKGMPEISILIPLCEILEVSIEELLLGEHLTEDNSKITDLQKKETEHFNINFIQDTKTNRSQNRYTMIFQILTYGIVIGIILLTLKQCGINVIVLLDLPSFLCILIPTIVFLAGTNFWKPFWNGIGILFGKKADVSKEAVMYSKNAITLTANMMFLLGFFLSMLQIIALFYTYKSGTLEIMAKNVSVALFPFLYGVMGFLILFLARGRLHTVL